LGPEAVTFPGRLSVIAGNGTKTYSGDGSGPEIHPNQVAIDTAGNVLVADAANSVIWRIDGKSGDVTRIAGTVGISAYAGDGGAAAKAELSMPQGVAVDAAGNIFVADTQNYRIRRVDAQTGTITTYAGAGTQGASGDGGLAINSGFNLPISLGFDPQGTST
jgi:streptogramin lyase